MSPKVTKTKGGKFQYRTRAGKAIGRTKKTKAAAAKVGAKRTKRKAARKKRNLPKRLTG